MRNWEREVVDDQHAIKSAFKTVLRYCEKFHQNRKKGGNFPDEREKQKFEFFAVFDVTYRQFH